MKLSARRSPQVRNFLLFALLFSALITPLLVSGSATGITTQVSSGQEYKIINKKSGKCIDIYGGSTEEHAQAQQYDCTGGNNQQFQFEPAGGGYYTIRIGYSGKCLDVYGAGNNNQAVIQQYSCNGGGNQQFLLEPAGGGYYTIKARHSAKCWDIFDASTANQAKLQQYDCNGGDNQKFRLDEVAKPAPLEDGLYTVTAKHSGKCVDIYDASTCEQTVAQQYECNGHNNQKYRITKTKDGYYSIVAAHSGGCLDVFDASRDNHAQIQQYRCNGGDNQKWTITPSGDGYYTIKARHSGKCLDVFGLEQGNNAKLQQYDCNGGNNQQFRIETTKLNERDAPAICGGRCDERGPTGCGVWCRVTFPQWYDQLILAFKGMKSHGMKECDARRLADNGAGLAKELYEEELGPLAGVAAGMVAAHCGQCAVDSAY